MPYFNVRGGVVTEHPFPDEVKLKEENKSQILPYIQRFHNSNKGFLAYDLRALVKSHIITRKIPPIDYVESLIDEILAEKPYFQFETMLLKDQRKFYYKKEDKMFDLKQEVKNAIKRKMETDEMFTAYTLTQELRGLFPNQYIYHDGPQGVKALVHEIYDYDELGDGGIFSCSWGRQTAPVVGNTLAQVYFNATNPNHDPQNFNSGNMNSYVANAGVNAPVTKAPQYIPKNQSAVGNSKLSPSGKTVSLKNGQLNNGTAPKFTASNTVGNKITKSKNKGTVVTLDKDGRLRLGKQVTEEAGFKPGDKVYVFIKPEEEKAPVKIFREKKNHKCLERTVDEYGNVRFSLKNQPLKGSKFETVVRGTPDPQRAQIPGQKGTWIEVQVK